MSEIIGRCMYFHDDLRGSGTRQRKHGAGSRHGPPMRRRSGGSGPPARRDHECLPLTEPFVAGADPTVVTTTAVRDATKWVINGHKWFTTNASSADIIPGLRRDQPEGRPHKHASIFIVPAGAPGMDVVRDIGTICPPRAGVRTPGQPRRGSSSAIAGYRPTTSSARPATVSCWHSSGSAAAGSITRCAGSGRRSARSTSCASARSPGPRTAGCSASTRWCRTTWRSHTWRSRPPGC